MTKLLIGRALAFQCVPKRSSAASALSARALQVLKRTGSAARALEQLRRHVDALKRGDVRELLNLLPLLEGLEVAFRSATVLTHTHTHTSTYKGRQATTGRSNSTTISGKATQKYLVGIEN